MIVFRDVTEKRKIEQRLAQSDRLASLGTMAAGMAHEINNPLAYVIANIDYGIEQLQAVIGQLDTLRGSGAPQVAVSEVRDTLAELVVVQKEAGEGADRVRRIVHDLKRFARAESVTHAVLDLPDVLDSAVKMTNSVVRHHAHLRKDYGTTPFVEASEGQLTQVFMNLLMNAAQAMKEGDAQHQEIRIATFTDAGGRAVVEVRDTGCGIPKEVLPRIFDPFFSTKGVGGGMGLGLSICHDIISAIGGEISVESRPGAGTTFRVSLAPAQSVKAKAPDMPLEKSEARRGKVLVIDDEAAVAQSLARILKSKHDVTVVTDAREGLAKIAAGASYDVIFCDLMMPAMSGIDVHQALVLANPEQAKRMVFMTGGTFSQHSQDFLDRSGNVVLTKPFAAETIRSIAADYVK